MKMEQTQCSETLAYKIQTLGNYPEESIQKSSYGSSRATSVPLMKKFRDFCYENVKVTFPLPERQ